MITVYGNTLSPFARKVFLVLEMKGVPFVQVDVLPHAELPEFTEASPAGLVPAIRDDDFVISDSSVICDYLENVYPEPALYPEDPKVRARALWLEEYADTRLRAVLLDGLLRERVANPVVRGIPTDELRVREIVEVELPPDLDYLESECPGEGFITGEVLSFADIAIVTNFISGRSADFDVDPSRWPRLSRYLERLSAEDVIAARLAREADYVAELSEK